METFDKVVAVMKRHSCLLLSVHV